MENPGGNMNELEGSTKDESGKPGKEIGEGSVECGKGGSEGVGGVEEKKCDKRICENEIPKRENVKKNVGKCWGVLANLKKVKSVTSGVLADKRRMIFSPNGIFLTAFLMCYIFLANLSLNSLVHHLEVTGSLTEIVKNGVIVILRTGCLILFICFPYMIRQHFTKNFHINVSERNCCRKEHPYCMKRGYELVCKGTTQGFECLKPKRKESEGKFYYGRRDCRKSRLQGVLEPVGKYLRKSPDITCTTFSHLKQLLMLIYFSYVRSYYVSSLIFYEKYISIRKVRIPLVNFKLVEAGNKVGSDKYGYYNYACYRGKSFKKELLPMVNGTLKLALNTS